MCVIVYSWMQNGVCALHMASRHGHVEVVIDLLEHGANPNSQDMVGCSCCI